MVKKLYVFLLLINAFTVISQDKPYPNCCFCVEDHLDKNSLVTICKKKFESCSYKETISFEEYKNEKYIPPSCEQTYFFGTFHANTKYKHVPFHLVNWAAINFNSKEIFYDGVSCQIFDDLNSIASDGKKIAKGYPDIKFEIKGNQNLGAAKRKFPIFSNYEELDEYSSKAIIKIENGESELTFDPCSLQSERCFIDRDDNEGNIKSCIDSNGNTQFQTCCPRKKYTDIGFWGPVGENCQ